MEPHPPNRKHHPSFNLLTGRNSTEGLPRSSNADSSMRLLAPDLTKRRKRFCLVTEEWLAGPVWPPPEAQHRRVHHLLESVRLLRADVIKHLSATGAPLLVDVAKRVGDCLRFASYPRSPLYTAIPCREPFCPMCSRIKAAAERKAFSTRVADWRKRGLVIVKFVLSLPHGPRDAFGRKADDLLDAFASLRRNKLLRDCFKDYRVAIHPHFSANGPHPHIHVMAGMQPLDAGLSSDGLQRIYEDVLRSGWSKAQKQVCHASSLANPSPPFMRVRIVDQQSVHEEIERTINYNANVLFTTDDAKCFFALTAKELLELQEWLAPPGRKRRRLYRGSVRRVGKTL